MALTALADHRGLSSTLTALLDEIPLALIQLDFEGKVLDLNDCAQRLLSGRGGEEIRRLLQDLCRSAGALSSPAELITQSPIGELRVLLAPAAQRRGFVAMVERRAADRLKAETAALRSMLGAAVAAMPVEEAALHALRTVSAILKGGVILHTLSDSTKDLELLAATGVPEQLSALALARPLDPKASTACQAAIYGRPLHLADLGRSAIEWERTLSGDKAWAMLVLPVRASGQVVGVLSVCHEPDMAGENEVRMIQGLADALGALLSRARHDSHLAAEIAARRSLMENLPDAIVEQGPDGRITLAAGRVMPIFGRASHELTGACLESALAEGDRDAFRQFVSTVNESVPLHAEFTVQTPEGRSVPCEVSVSATGEAGRATLRAVFRDLSARRALEWEVARAREIATRREKLAAIGQLAAGVAHEINNPLAFVKSNTHTLASYIAELERYVMCGGERKSVSELLEEMRAMAEESMGGIERIANIAQALKGMARTDTGAGTIFDPARAISDAVLIFRGAKKGVVELELGEVPHIKGTPGGLGQILLNLLENAFDAMGGKGTITIRAHDASGRLKITVDDRGPGIPEEIRDRVFEPFFTTKESGKGTGLGLYISHEICKQMCGEISFESGPNGTTFFLEFPGVD